MLLFSFCLFLPIVNSLPPLWDHQVGLAFLYTSCSGRLLHPPAFELKGFWAHTRSSGRAVSNGHSSINFQVIFQNHPTLQVTTFGAGTFKEHHGRTGSRGTSSNHDNSWIMSKRPIPTKKGAPEWGLPSRVQRFLLHFACLFATRGAVGKRRFFLEGMLRALNPFRR